MGAQGAIGEADDAVHKSECHLRHLNTLAVTLFPTRAQIWREIRGMQLKRGTNEITIVGLSPTVDEDSIKVEGSGSATITDIAIELLPNREIFEEVYPDLDDADSGSDSDNSEDEDGDEDEQTEGEDLHLAKHVLHHVKSRREIAEEQIANALQRLRILNDYARTFDCKHGIAIQDALNSYKEQREKAFEDHRDANTRLQSIKEQMEKAERKLARLQRQENKKKAQADRDKEKARKEKQREREKRQRRKEEARRERNRVRSEREKFWPKVCYSVRITLEGTTFTPSSSRRASVSGDQDYVVKMSAAEIEDDSDDGLPLERNLVLSYVTTSAYWSPKYDLQLSTTNATASLYFDAMLTNFTSETWSNCKVTLSTSQTTFAGLDDAIPSLVRWRIKLASKDSGIFQSDIIQSREEHEASASHLLRQRQSNAQKPRSLMFGPPEKDVPRMKRHQIPTLQETAANDAITTAPTGNNPFRRTGGSLFHNSDAPGAASVRPVAAVSAGLFGSRRGGFGAIARGEGGGGLFGSAAPEANAGGGRGGPFSSAFGAPRQSQQQQQTRYFDGDLLSCPATQQQQQQTVAAEENSIGEEADKRPDLDFQESLMEETGLTTTYDLPGLKTLAPRSAGSRQRITRMAFSSVAFSHTVVAKYRPVAYLKAKLKNTSKLMLFRGQAGLTLDGTFLGKTSIPRCSPREAFSLSLGVDPAVRVSYSKPEVRRTTPGLFSKENSSVYVRTVVLHNTRAAAGRRVSLLVLDQIPVPEDERLRVELVEPRLAVDGGGVAAGAPGRDAVEDNNWGKATAMLNKSGEVSWQVSLKAGKAVKLKLEYAVSMPGGDHALQC